MKKILSAIAAAVAALTMSITAFAADTIDKPTMVFDDPVALDYVHTFGNVSETNLKYELSDDGAISGRCLVISENIAADINSRDGGIYFDAADFGLDSFSGYTMTLNMKFSKDTTKAVPSITFYSDGDLYVEELVSTAANNKWVTATVYVPAGKLNSHIGISFPIISKFSGEVVRIDNMKLTDNYGTLLANVGDEDLTLAEKPGTFRSVMTVLAFILLIAVVVGGVILVAKKVFGRYR